MNFSLNLYFTLFLNFYFTLSFTVLKGPIFQSGRSIVIFVIEF